MDIAPSQKAGELSAAEATLAREVEIFGKKVVVGDDVPDALRGMMAEVVKRTKAAQVEGKTIILYHGITVQGKEYGSVDENQSQARHNVVGVLQGGLSLLNVALTDSKSAAKALTVKKGYVLVLELARDFVEAREVYGEVTDYSLREDFYPLSETRSRARVIPPELIVDIVDREGNVVYSRE